MLVLIQSLRRLRYLSSRSVKLPAKVMVYSSTESKTKMKELIMTLTLMPMLARHNEKVRTAAARVTCVLLLTMISLFALADSWTDPETGYTWKYKVSGETAEINNSYSVAISPLPVGDLT